MKIIISLKGNKSQCFGDMGPINLIKSNNFQQQSYFSVSGIRGKNRTHSRRNSMDYVILEKE